MLIHTETADTFLDKLTVTGKNPITGASPLDKGDVEPANRAGARQEREYISVEYNATQNTKVTNCHPTTGSHSSTKVTHPK